MFKAIHYWFDADGKKLPAGRVLAAADLFASALYLTGPSHSFDVPHYTVVRRHNAATDPWDQGDGQPFEVVGRFVHPVVRFTATAVRITGLEVPGLACGGRLRHPFKMKSKVPGPWFPATLLLDRSISYPDTLQWQSVTLEV